MKPIKTSETEQLYSMIALMKCAELYKDYLCQNKAVGGGTKMHLKGVFDRFNYFLSVALKTGTPEDREKWAKDWSRDYAVFASVFAMMSQMTDEERGMVEDLCTAIRNGERIETVVIDNPENKAA